jgi:hypothetical protein
LFLGENNANRNIGKSKAAIFAKDTIRIGRDFGRFRRRLFIPFSVCPNEFGKNINVVYDYGLFYEFGRVV